MRLKAVVESGHGVKQNQSKPKNTEANDNPYIICLNTDCEQSSKTNQCQNGADQMRNTIEFFTVIHSYYLELRLDVIYSKASSTLLVRKKRSKSFLFIVPYSTNVSKLIN